jgi:FkbM family methyltransferase
MSIISKNKDKIINTLRLVNNLPGFRRVFYWIHEIRCTPFKPPGFIASLIDNSFLLGVYNIECSPTWKRMANGSFEEAETEVVKKLINYFDLFIDIGGHIGYFTCLVGSIKPDTEIMVFEPSPTNFKSLEKNIGINRLNNVKKFNIGLSNKSDFALLYGVDALSSFNKGSFGSQPAVQQNIKLEPLNLFTEQIPLNKNVFIKIDVEAKEYDVIKGADIFIKKIRPIGLMVEICDEWSGGTNPHFKDTFDLITSFGYKSYLIDTKFPLKETNSIEKLAGANYLFIRNDLVEEISSKTNIV